MPRASIVVVVLLSVPPVARAQAPTQSFADLRSRLSIGETVFVTNEAGKTVKGKLRRLSDTMLVLRTGADELTVTVDDVRRISRPGHSTRNGALIGFAGGFVAGAAWAAAQPCQFTCFSQPGGVLLFGGLGGLIGTGIGAAVGASLHKEHVVFVRAATGRLEVPVASPLASAAVTLAPSPLLRSLWGRARLSGV